MTFGLKLPTGTKITRGHYRCILSIIFSVLLFLILVLILIMLYNYVLSKPVFL